MQTCYWFNTAFEDELSNPKAAISTIYPSNKIALQLQWLSLYLAENNDLCLVFGSADDRYLKQLKQLNSSNFSIGSVDRSLEEGEGMKLECWGSTLTSNEIRSKAQMNGVNIDPDIVASIHNKRFLTDFLKDGQAPLIIQSIQEVESAIKELGDIRFLLKPTNRCSGQGFIIFEADTLEENRSGIESAIERYSIMLLEPYRDRIQDFSSHWYIESKHQINYKGICELVNRKQGMYWKTRIAPEEQLFKENSHYIVDHLSLAIKVCQKAAAIGYRGPISFDGYLYQKDNQMKLMPFCDVNCRWTVSSWALAFHKRFFKNSSIEISLEKSSSNKEGLLPSSISIPRQGQVNFDWNLFLRKK